MVIDYGKRCFEHDFYKKKVVLNNLAMHVYDVFLKSNTSYSQEIRIL